MNVTAVRSFVIGVLAAVALVAAGCTTPSGGNNPGPKALVDAGGTHSCSVDQNRQVACWGQNARGQLGIGSFVDSPPPRFVPGMSNTTAVSVSLMHTCAIRLGSVYCWGGNPNGQVGDGSTVDRPSPVQVPGLANITQIGTGVMHNCALDVAGVVRCWGGNGNGQLGDGSTVDSLVPVEVTGIPPVASLSVKGYHSCALTTTGSPRCWGANGQGQLGDGTTVDAAVPVAPQGIPTASKLDTGTFHTCATVAGAAACWGNNSNGQLGTGTTTPSLVPVQVPGLTGVTSLAMGSFHSCAVVGAGAAKCWGFNTKGQLGNGTTTNSLVPVSVAGVSGLTSLSGGLTHTCGVVLQGTQVVCWGDNIEGQLGNTAAGGLSTAPVNVDAATVAPPVVPPNNVNTVSNYDLDCQASLGGTPVQTHLVAAETSVSHPASVDAGETFRVVITSADVDVPLTYPPGVTLQNMANFRLRIAIPDNVDVLSASYLPGVNTGAGTPSVTDNGTYVELLVPGPLTPGTTATLPSIDLELQATGPSGVPINFTSAGASYGDWGYSFLVNVAGVGAVTDRCFVDPSPILGSVSVN